MVELRIGVNMGNISACIRLNGGDADVHVGNQAFTVVTSSKSDRENTCPVELIIGALGS
jgi:hypothetical protein